VLVVAPSADDAHSLNSELHGWIPDDTDARTEACVRTFVMIALLCFLFLLARALTLNH